MKKKIYINLYGGLGDVALSTPIFKELKQQFPDSKIIAIGHSKGQLEVLKNNPYIDTFRYLTIFYKFLYKFLKTAKIIKIIDINYGSLRPSFTYSTKAAEIIAEMAGIKLTEPNIQIFLREEEDIKAKTLLSNYVNPIIIHITSIASKNQMWPHNNWNELVKSLPDHTFIQLGLANELKVEGAIDLRGKTNVREGMALIKHAYSFVGVVSFFSHVTNAFNKKGIVFFGPSSLSVWGHENNINISKNLICAPCVDFLKNAECPYDKMCMQMISVDEVKEAIVQIGLPQNLPV